MTTAWAKIKSWHIFVVGEQRSLCGRDINGKPQSTAPDPEDKTCERCFQIREGRR